MPCPSQLQAPETPPDTPWTRVQRPDWPPQWTAWAVPALKLCGQQGLTQPHSPQQPGGGRHCPGSSRAPERGWAAPAPRVLPSHRPDCWRDLDAESQGPGRGQAALGLAPWGHLGAQHSGQDRARMRPGALPLGWGGPRHPTEFSAGECPVLRPGVQGQGRKCPTGEEEGGAWDSTAGPPRESPKHRAGSES